MKNSKTEEKIKSFDTVKTFREIKNKISEETYGMSIDDFKKYLNKKSNEFQKEQKALSANSKGFVACAAPTMKPVLNGTDYKSVNTMELSKSFEEE